MKRYLFLLLFISHSAFCSSALDYFSSNAKETLVGDEASIKLLTWNILGLPNNQVGVRPWEERIDAMAEKILSMNAEIVVLQECFEPELSLGLRDRLGKRYAHIYLHLQEKTTLLPSGLALFSKLPVADFRFIPHSDLLDTERNSKMGIIEFVLLNSSHLPVAHIAASHFQGSSNCEWRVGLTEDGNRLSYAQVRQQEAGQLLKLSSFENIPHYVCGDLNVDRHSLEYCSSLLNEKVSPQLVNKMTSSMKLLGTNTNFWKHEKGIANLYPQLEQSQTIALALRYKQLYENKLKDALLKDPWDKPLSDFDASFFSQSEKELNIRPEDQVIWEYFKIASTKAIARETELWQLNQNEGNSPHVSIGRVIEIRALPIEESLDYILGINDQALIQEIAILEGYDDSSSQSTLSDHHLMLATIRVASGTDSHKIAREKTCKDRE